MKTIHKYVLTEHLNRIPTHEGARVVHVANQREQITVWAEVNTLARECLLTLHVVGTGHELHDGARHVGSAVMAGGNFVFHVYAGGYTTADPRATARETTEPEEGEHV